MVYGLHRVVTGPHTGEGGVWSTHRCGLHTGEGGDWSTHR